jgi:hypothetical protein
MQKWVLFFLALVIMLNTNAQERPVVIGVSINPGISWVQPENSHFSSEGPVFSFSYGLNLDFYFNKNYALATGLTVLTWGGNVSYPDLYPQDTTLTQVRSVSAYKYSAIQVPLYLKLKTNPIGYNSYFAEFGLSFLFPFKTSINTTSTYEDGTSVDRGTESIKDNAPFVSVNLLLGAGIEIPISGNTKAQISLQFLNGISSLSTGKAYKTDGNGNVTDEEIENGGNPTGQDLVYYLKGLYLNLRIIF